MKQFSYYDTCCSGPKQSGTEVRENKADNSHVAYRNSSSSNGVVWEVNSDRRNVRIRSSASLAADELGVSGIFGDFRMKQAVYMAEKEATMADLHRMLLLNVFRDAAT